VSTPSDRIVVYDGHCHLCSGWIRFFEQHRVEPPFSLLPSQSERGRALLVQHGIDPDDPTTFLVVDRGTVYTASDATVHLLTRPGGAWGLLAGLRIIPRSWRDAVYGLIARNRYRWFGRRATCRLPSDR
jgi:predicted DCC family thiol-disulfide oxidoreductase YuxK